MGAIRSKLGRDGNKISSPRLVKHSLGLVFGRPFYSGLALTVAILTFSLFVFLTNIPLIAQAIRSYSLLAVMGILGALIVGIDMSAGHTTVALMATVAIMVGMNISLLVFKLARLRRSSYKEGGTSLAGIVGGVLGAGCPACATGLLASLGVSGGLAIFPFRGLEIKLLSVFILALSQYWLLASIADCKSCKVSYQI